MAQVDFYVLDKVDEHSRDTLACKLAEKAWRLENTIHIHTMGPDDAGRLDKLLWTFRDGSFVPHELASGDSVSPVTIGYGDDEIAPKDLLITLCDDIPACAGAFPRIAELVTSETESRAKSRTRYATYRDQGHELKTYNI